MRASRRSLLQRTLAGAAGVSLATLARWSLAADAPEITRVTDDLTLIAGLGGNILVRATRAGQVVVDSGAAIHSARVIETLAALPGGGRVDMLLNTHWHLDQTGSNLALGRAGATIIAHEKTRQRLATDYYLPDEDRYERALPAEAQPSATFYSSGETLIGDTAIAYGHLLQAHTDGDIYVHFRDVNVMAVGDAVSPVRDPALDWFGGGWIGGRVDALALLLAISDAQTRFVPSYGPVVGRDAVEREHDLMLTLFERMVELVRQGMSPEDVLAAGVMDGLSRVFDAPLEFVYAAHKSLWAHHNTLSHDIV